MPRVPHFGALCLLLLLRLWQVLGLAPLRIGLDEGRRCRRRWRRGSGARCHRFITTSAVLHWLALLALSPLMLRQSVAIYESTNVKHSKLFERIALATMAGDVTVSLALLGTHIWQRRRLARLVTGLARLQRRHQLSWPAVLLVWGKLLLSLYELLCNVPFLQQNAPRLPWLQLAAYGIQLYVQHMSSVFGNGVFGALLLLLTCLQDLELQWQQSPQPDLVQRECLLRRERRLLLVCEDFVGVLQVGVFLLVIGNFINILANMYAYMSYFVGQHGIPLTISNYCAIVAIQLYALILATHLCQVEHAKLRRRSLELCYVPEQLTEEQAMLPTPLLMWPLDGLKFSILGLFNLDHAFWLFLVSYAVNFIVIILQFTVENLVH